VSSKSGLELFVKEGAAAVRRGPSSARDVFLDLKLNDIRHRRVAVASARVGVPTDIHAEGGAMVEAAVRGRAGVETSRSWRSRYLSPLERREICQPWAITEGASAHALRLGKGRYSRSTTA